MGLRLSIVGFRHAVRPKPGGPENAERADAYDDVEVRHGRPGDDGVVGSPCFGADSGRGCFQDGRRRVRRRLAWRRGLGGGWHGGGGFGGWRGGGWRGGYGGGGYGYRGYGYGRWGYPGWGYAGWGWGVPWWGWGYGGYPGDYYGDYGYGSGDPYGYGQAGYGGASCWAYRRVWTQPHARGHYLGRRLVNVCA